MLQSAQHQEPDVHLEIAVAKRDSAGRCPVVLTLTFVPVQIIRLLRFLLGLRAAAITHAVMRLEV